MTIYDDPATIYDAPHVTFDGLTWQHGNVAVGLVAAYLTDSAPVLRSSVATGVIRGSVESDAAASTVTVDERP